METNQGSLARGEKDALLTPPPEKNQTKHYNLKERFTASVTRRDRKRLLKGDRLVVQVRYVVNFREPGTGTRRQLFFDRRTDAMEARDNLVASVKGGEWRNLQSSLTVAQATEHWLAARRHQVKASTWESYRRGIAYVVGPLLVGSPQERRKWARGSLRSASPVLIPMLGMYRVADVTTAQIRAWHATLVAHVGSHTAHAAKKFLRAALSLAAEDFQVHVPPMPTQLQRGHGRGEKQILSVAQVGALLRMAADDRERGIYYAFPFLTGVRPSEQLGLLWQDVDFAEGCVRVCRMQEADGTLSSMTKTTSSQRVVPLPGFLLDMLRAWQVICPRDRDGLGRVFPALGRQYEAGGPYLQQGRPLTYVNFRAHYWKPAFQRCGLPYVTPHSARHTFISVMQACGIEVGLVSKLAGHSNATITLSHYTQAVRGGQDAVARLQNAYLGQSEIG